VEKLLNLKRFENATSQGRVIADPLVVLGSGVYNHDDGKAHPCIHVQDPERGSERLIYVLTPDAAATIVQGLLGAIQRVNAK